MSAIALSPFVIFSVAVTTLLAWAGGRAERWAAAAFFAVMIVTPFIQHRGPWAVPLSSLMLASLLLWWALTKDRWWLIFAAGCQLLALATHVVTLIRLENLVWAAITVRWLSWFALMGVALFGAWEGWALKRIQRAGPPARITRSSA